MWGEICLAVTLVLAGVALFIRLVSCRKALRLASEELLSLREKLQEQELLVRSLQEVLEDSRDAIIMYDRNGKIRFWNCGASELYRRTQSETLGKSILELLPPDAYSTAEDALRDIMDKGIEGSFETKRRMGTGEELDVSVSVVLNTDENLEIVGLTTNERDLSDRIAIENELKEAKEQAERGTKAKSEFLANMSHEIRTPMNGVLGMTHLLLDTELSADQREQLMMVHTSAEALLQIINDILDFSKIEAGKIVFEKHPFEFDKVIESIAASLAFKAKEKEIELVLSCNADIPQVLIGDSTRLSQVVINLVGNAIKFTPHGGGICVQFFLENKDGSLATIHGVIADSGIGIPKEKQALIFEAFSQADASTTRQFGGTGLGLSISSNLVRLMGGKVFVESVPDRGTAFHFTAQFPIGDSSQLLNLQPKEEIESEPLSKLNILLAEDNLVNQKLAIRLLEKSGHTVMVVSDGRLAVEAVKTSDFDLILMDCQMPIMGGFEATALIRAQEEGQSDRIPVIALTANAMKGDRERCIEAGMDDYVSKPIKPAELNAAISRATSSKR